jgi:hypothetical protein
MVNTLGHDELLVIIQNLDTKEQLKLLEELTMIIKSKVKKNRSILELKELGKEIWKSIDAQEYVNKERDSWNNNKITRQNK